MSIRGELLPTTTTKKKTRSVCWSKFNMPFFVKRILIAYARTTSYLSHQIGELSLNHNC
jgi:hypothetical protein